MTRLSGPAVRPLASRSVGSPGILARGGRKHGESGTLAPPNARQDTPRLSADCVDFVQIETRSRAGEPGQQGTGGRVNCRWFPVPATKFVPEYVDALSRMSRT